MQAQPVAAGADAARVLNERNAFVMDSLLKEVARSGTAARASAALKRTDIGGKTGTTNDSPRRLVCRLWRRSGRRRVDGIRPAAAARRARDRRRPRSADLDQLHVTRSRRRAGGCAQRTNGVVQLGGEYYYVEHQPGQGVASLGMEDGLPPKSRPSARPCASRFSRHSRRRAALPAAMRRPTAENDRRTTSATGSAIARQRTRCHPACHASRHRPKRNDALHCARPARAAASAPAVDDDA